MRKLIVPLLAGTVAAALILGSCAPAPEPAPAPAPEPAPEPTTGPAPLRTAADVPELDGLCRPDLWMDFGEPFAFKPDGTPFRIHVSYFILTVEEMVNLEGIMHSLIDRTGAEYSMYDAGWDVDIQTGNIEDLAAMDPPDIMIVQAVNEVSLAPAIDKAAAAGIRCYANLVPCYSDNIISGARHWAEGPIGGGLCGKKWVELAESENKQYNVLEIWAARGLQETQARHEGHLNEIKDHPLITLTESADTYGSEEQVAQVIIDAFTANPELNGIFKQGGGQVGIPAGLKAIDRWHPKGHPDHVVINTFELTPSLSADVKSGHVDYFSSHGPWDLTDLSVKQVLWDAVCGVDMPRDVIAPMFLVSGETINNPDHYMFGAYYWSEMPPGQWDKWPILDFSEPGSLQILPDDIRGLYFGESTPWQLATPTIADRMENAGY